MASKEENIKRFQEIANRGLEDRLPADKRAIFDEALRRGLITSQASTEDPALEAVAPIEQPLQPAPQDEEGFIAKAGGAIKSMVTGEGKTTRDMENLPTIMNSGFLKGQPASVVAKVAPLVALTNNPMETAQIIKANVPGVTIQTNKDAEGNIYPVLTNKEGVTALVNKPGLDMMDLGQFATQASAFMVGPGVTSIPKTIAKEAAIEGAIQGAQAAGGGEFDAGDVAMSGLIAGGGKLAEDAIGAGAKAFFGKVDEGAKQVIKAGEEFNVPVMSSDIYAPENWFTRSLQFTGESVPLIGTGGLRSSQQEARDQAVDQFVSLYRGGSYEEIIESIGKRNNRLKKAAGEVYNKINPKLDGISKNLGGVPTTRTSMALDELSDFATDPELKMGDDVMNLLDDMDFYLRSPKSYQSLRDNISSYQAKIDSIDPKIRDQLPSKVKAKFNKVLAAARRDRDEFSQAYLDGREFAKLKQADALYGEVSKNLKETKIKGILDKGDVTPEIAAQMLYSSKPSDIKRLYSNLTAEGKQNSRSVIIGDVISKLEKRAGEEISPTQLVNELRKRKGTLDVFFKGKDRDQLNGFMRLLEHTRRAGEVTKGAGSQSAERLLAGGVMGAGIFQPSILAGYGSVGAMSRVFESPRMRGILMKMNGTAPGTAEFQRLSQQAATIFRAGAQASPEKGSSELEKDISEDMRQQYRALQ